MFSKDFRSANGAPSDLGQARPRPGSTDRRKTRASGIGFTGREVDLGPVPTAPLSADHQRKLDMARTLLERACSLLPPETDGNPGSRERGLRTAMVFANLQAIVDGRISLRP